jgi:hypothetical protein
MVEKHGTVVMFRFLIRVSKRVFPEQYYQTIVLSTSVPERRQRVGGIILVVMVNRLAPLSRSEGRARREPFGGVGSTGWLYKPPARLSPAHCYFSTQPSFLLDKLLPDTSLHLHPAIYAPSSPNYLLTTTTPSIWSKQVRGHQELLPRREQLTNIPSQQSSLVPLVVSDR